MNKLLLVVFLLFATYGFSQDSLVQSVKIKKETNIIYQGQESNLKNWFLCFDNVDTYYLSRLNINPSEVKSFFDRRKNSQSVYKGQLNLQSYKVIVFAKENQPEDNLSFYFEKKNEIIYMTFIESGELFTFKKLSFD